jgi:signal transduction histidine kinase
MLTRQILAFGRRQVFHSRPLDLNEVIDEAQQLILHLVGEPIRVESHLEVGLGRVLADPVQITQVLLNLAVNAREAMRDGGRVTVETANVDLGAADAHAAGLEPGAYVVLEVADTGCGMDVQIAQRAFEPFFTTKPLGEGAGLGLAMVDGIAQQSGGRATIESVLGQGTVVRVYLPRIP